MSLGSRIRDLRNKKGKTQQQMADALKMGRSNFGHIENDRVTPTSDDLQIIADILETSTDYLLGRAKVDQSTVIKESATPYEVPSWATTKDKRDFKKMLEEDTEIMFDGVPLDNEDKEKVLKVLEAVFWDAKKINKRKPIDE